MALPGPGESRYSTHRAARRAHECRWNPRITGSGEPRVAAVRGTRWLEGRPIIEMTNVWIIREAARSMRLSLTEVVTLDGGGSQSVSGSEEAARVVNDEMARSAGSWSLRVGYITMSPRRMYFTVEFGADGRVASVSDVEWGRLD